MDLSASTSVAPDRHTPWRASHWEGRPIVLDDEGSLVAGTDTDADANLIAAAPELLKSLKTLLNWYLGSYARKDPSRLDVDLARDARAAILKAEGQ